jgi:hypothetical protein
MNSGASTSVIVASSLISTCSDGPGLVRFGALPAIRAGLDVLLRVVPGTAAVVQEDGHEDTRDRRDHQQGRDAFRTHELVRAAEMLEHETDDDREENDERTRQDHRLECTHRHDVDAGGVIGILGALHDARTFPELTTHFGDDRGRGLAHRRHRERGEPEYQHRAKQAGDEHDGLRQVDVQRASRKVTHLVEIRGEQQERRERGGADGVPLRQRLGRVADRVEPIGLLTNGLGLARHLDDATGIVRDRAEDVHREDVAGRPEHPHRRDRGAEQSADRLTRGIHQAAVLAERVAGDDRCADRDHRENGRLHADREARDDVRRRTSLARLGNAQHRAVTILRVILRDEDEKDRGDDPDHAAEKVVPPRIRRRVDLQQHAAGEEEHDRHERRRDVVTEIERLHRIGVFLGAHHHHADDRADQPERHDDEREQDAVDAERLVEQHTKDHGADVLGGGALEQVGAAAGAVADIVADEIRDHGRVARIVFRNARFDLADQIRADVSRLGVDATPQLREQRDE